MATIPFQLTLRPDDSDPNPDEIERARRNNWDSAWKIITDYVQTDSKLSLDDAVEQVSQYWIGAPFENPLALIPVVMAEQIPYDHPAHKKLAEFVLVLSRSEKWMAGVEPEIRGQAFANFWDQFAISLYDDHYRPDVRFAEPEDPLMYANFCAFDANVIQPIFEKPADFKIPPIRQTFRQFAAKFALDEATEVDPEAPAEVRDAWVIGAAQYIVYQAPGIFREAVEDRERQAEREERKGRLAQQQHYLRRSEDDPDVDLTWNRWQNWKRMFGTVAIDESYGKTCRDVAQRAADLMTLQEKMEDDCAVGTSTKNTVGAAA